MSYARKAIAMAHCSGKGANIQVPRELVQFADVLRQGPLRQAAERLRSGA